MIVEERTIEQAAQRYCEMECNKRPHIFRDINEQLWFMGACKISFEKGAKSPEAKEFHTKGMYDDDDVWKLLNKYLDYQEHGLDNLTTIEWFEQNKKK